MKIKVSNLDREIQHEKQAYVIAITMLKASKVKSPSMMVFVLELRTRDRGPIDL